MDIYNLVFDIIEHPEKYSSEQLAEIMSEPETRDIYNLLCKMESAIKADNRPDINVEWNKFSGNHDVGQHHIFSRFVSRAASIVAIVCTSIAAVGAGIAVSLLVIEHKTEPIVNEVAGSRSVMSVATDTLTACKDTVNARLTPVMFEDEPLERIMEEIAGAYGIEVRFNNKEVATLHLYYKLDLSLPLNDVIEQLNTFEQIDIRQNGNILNID